MKLLFCTFCGDVFNLKEQLKTCGCGKTKGKYINNEEAVVNGNGVSLAIGNGSLQKAIFNMSRETEDWRNTQTNPYGEHPSQIICWARYHDGPTNPHTQIQENL